MIMENNKMFKESFHPETKKFSEFFQIHNTKHADGYYLDKSKPVYKVYSNDKKESFYFTGELQEFYEDGKKSKIINYFNGKSNGEYFLFSKLPGNFLTEKGEMLNGKKHGKITLYNMEGKIDLIQEYQNDELNGISELYDLNGNIFSRIEYKNNEKNGNFVQYHENGDINIIRKYINNEILEEKTYKIGEYKNSVKLKNNETEINFGY